LNLKLSFYEMRVDMEDGATVVLSGIRALAEADGYAAALDLALPRLFLEEAYELRASLRFQLIQVLDVLPVDRQELMLHFVIRPLVLGQSPVDALFDDRLLMI
jgi:hypothetical protein